MRGISDIPVENLQNDCFGLVKYVKGLSDYVLKCDTPTTGAVQGDWGCGKTSMLNMVREMLGTQVKSIWFNTWQYSKFNMDDQLSMSLLSHLYAALVKDSTGKSTHANVKEHLAVIAKAGVKVGSYVIDALGAQKFADDISGISFGNANDSTDIIDAIENLKSDFQREIDNIYQKEQKRVVVFIDDLDRLEPSKAVELMEVLKLFLDCKNCVYVLAIDYGVVTRGISDKYGEDFGKKQGKKFFDKIIQVPFFIPVEQYQIEEYIRKAMPTSVTLQDKDLPQYINLIKTSVGCNPRSMKRLFNAYLLICMINADKGYDKDSMAQKLLFAALCMQLSMEDIYRYIIEKMEDIDATFFEEFLDATNANEFEDYFPNIQVEDEELNKSNIILFMRELAKILADNASNISNKSFDKLKDIFSISSSTNNISIKTKGGTKVLDEDVVVEKVINHTDYKYKIITASAKLHIGFGKSIQLICNGKNYSAKMHSQAKGRIDGLSLFYADTDLKPGDTVVLAYHYGKSEISCEIIRADRDEEQ